MQQIFPRLRSGVPIAKPNGDASDDFTLKWQNTMQTLESVPEIQAAVAAAQAAAEQAQAAADSVTSDTGLSSSYVTGLIIEAFNDGADCHVDISNHFRIYNNQADMPIAVTGGTLSGIAHDTIVRVYYDQASRAGGTVSYQWTSDEATAAQTGDRHSVGSVVTPRASEVGSVIGRGVSPPGFAIP